MPRIRKIMGQPIDIGLIDLDVNAIRVRTPVSKPPQKPTYYHGYLRDHFVVEDGVIVNPTYYGDFVERGTSKMASRLMVARAIPTIAKRLAMRVVEQLDRVKLLDLPKKRS